MTVIGNSIKAEWCFALSTCEINLRHTVKFFTFATDFKRWAYFSFKRPVFSAKSTKLKILKTFFIFVLLGVKIMNHIGYSVIFIKNIYLS